MENNEVLTGSQPFDDSAETRTESVQPEPADEFPGLAFVDFTAEELHMCVSGLVAVAEEIRRQNPLYYCFQAKADKYFELATRLDEEYDDLTRED